MPYSDIPFNLKKHPSTKDVDVLSEERAIKNAVSNILMTSKGEVFYRPYFGCSVKRFLFEKLNEFTFLVIRDEIRYALYRNEPRIDNVHIEVIQLENRNEVEVTVEYRIKSLDLVTSQVLTLGIS
jgi:phage baseplate assembly protein W